MSKKQIIENNLIIEELDYIHFHPETGEVHMNETDMFMQIKRHADGVTIWLNNQFFFDYSKSTKYYVINGELDGLELSPTIMQVESDLLWRISQELFLIYGYLTWHPKEELYFCCKSLQFQPALKYKEQPFHQRLIKLHSEVCYLLKHSVSQAIEKTTQVRLPINIEQLHDAFIYGRDELTDHTYCIRFGTTPGFGRRESILNFTIQQLGRPIGEQHIAFKAFSEKLRRLNSRITRVSDRRT